MLVAVHGGGPRDVRTHAPVREYIHGGYAQPQPFLGSGGVVVQVAAVVAAVVAPPQRVVSGSRLPRPVITVGGAAALAAGFSSEGGCPARVRAGLLDTPPPVPRFRPVAGRAVQA